MREDIIDKVKHDHGELEKAFSNYDSAYKAGDDKEARKWFNKFVWEISRHSVAEEQVLYPMIANLGEKGQKLADQSREDHHNLKVQLVELQSTYDLGKFHEKMNVMMETFEAHKQMEEAEDLPYLEQHTDVSTRESAGKTFAWGKNLVPTRPHPGIPERPVALEAALGLLATPFDKIKDVFTSFPHTQAQ